MRRLLTHLAQFSSFSRQGEILCTRGLEYLLEHADARAAFSAHILAICGVALSRDLVWRAEPRQEDLDRPDLEGCEADGRPRVKVEAKLGASLGEAQLRSYALDLRERAGGGLLLVLVPQIRAGEASSVASKAFAADRASCETAVLTWESVLDCLEVVTSESFAADLSQFRAMYRVLVGDDIEPISSEDDLLAWREREGVFVKYADRATRRLAGAERLLPMGFERGPAQYFRRYVCRPLGGPRSSCFSVGVRDAFEGYVTPIWLRFHRRTTIFAEIRARLFAAEPALRLVESGGHVWIPLDVPLGAEAEAVIDSLVIQIERIVEVARAARTDS